jgi:hypothetical protein
MNAKVWLVIVALVAAAGGGWVGFDMGRSYQDAFDKADASVHLPDPQNPSQMIPALILRYRNEDARIAP